MKLVCDDREDGEVLRMVMEGIEGSEVKRLRVGDYVEKELGVCIERKTIDDLCGSIKDGRIKGQAMRMVDEYDRCFVLVSGKIEDRESDINENCILGMISSLVVMGVQVICVDNDKQLVYLMKRILERFNAHRESLDIIEREVGK